MQKRKRGSLSCFFLYIYHTKHLPSSISHLSARILVEKRASRGVVACWSWTESSWTGDGAEQRRWEWVESGCLWTRRPILHRLWCEWAEEEQRDRPGWRSLGLVSVPAAWGPARGLRLGNLSLSDPTERARQRVKEGGTREVKGEGDGGLCHLQYDKTPADVPADLQVWLSSASSPRPLGSLAGKRLLKYTSVSVSAHTSLPLSACRR